MRMSTKVDEVLIGEETEGGRKAAIYDAQVI
jgi:hypothetical protein